MQKTDLAKEQKQYYRAKATPEIVTIAAANFVTIEGEGDPNSALFNAKVKAMYATAYNIKKINKLQDKDFKVASLEGFWWTESGAQVNAAPLHEWQWKLRIQLPEFVTKSDFTQAVALAGNKKLAHLDELRFEHFPGTLAVQILHTGSYHDELPTIEKLLAYIKLHNLEITGPHHELYITDPSKTAAEKLRTILRLDVKSK
jgi:hypothetical protein